MSLSDAERAAGLDRPLPPGESMLWQAKPEPAAIARALASPELLGGWAAVAALLVYAGMRDAGHPASEGIAAMTLVLPFIAIGWAVLTLIGQSMGRAATYTLTNRRLILHIGVAFEITVSIPLSAVKGASIRRGKGESGDIAVDVVDAGGISWWALWPHARPWRTSPPQPMLRGLTDAEGACEAIGDALTAFNAGARVRLAAVNPAPAQTRPEVVAA